MVQPSTPMAAWRRASERVGWGWQVRATSSDAAPNSMATQYSPIISLTDEGVYDFEGSYEDYLEGEEIEKKTGKKASMKTVIMSRD